MFEFEESLSWFLFEISVLVLGSGFWFGGGCEGRSLTSGWDGVVHPSCRFQKKSERHEIALEPHWFRVQTERIKRGAAPYTEVKARFVSEKTGLAAEHAFFNAQQSGTFNEFIALLTQERSQAGLASDGTQVIPDELFKRQLLHRCDELLYLRATASPSFALDKFSVNALVAYLQTMWDAITLERATTGMRRLNLCHERGEPTQAVGSRTPRLEGAAKEKAMFEGHCFVCDTVGHISSNCPSKPNTASPRRDPPGSTPGPRMVAAIRAYEDTGDSTAFVGISSDSEDDDERLFASEPG
ncbi:BQ5605_C026g10229 [Microbotryum silenes-dioicae]|uniref:BQ5605_C026g10229 protein n=1 Tax=Microbotryum silenes-dioicae TaxID=796604 RepID=A0A2X0N946_9BASI|nr:BQ5605_C026g10229 [Microbotryum silenes-dioicae]